MSYDQDTSGSPVVGIDSTIPADTPNYPRHRLRHELERDAFLVALALLIFEAWRHRDRAWARAVLIAAASIAGALVGMVGTAVGEDLAGSNGPVLPIIVGAGLGVAAGILAACALRRPR